MPTGSAHPLHRPFLACCGGRLELPDLARLNALAVKRDLRSGSGQPLCFDSAMPCKDYEVRAFRTGTVATRPGNWHDVFNALVWLKFPQTKRLLNSLHVEALETGVDSAARGPLRDALTQFDECGVVVAGSDLSLWQEICSHRWQAVFVAQRAELLASTRFIVFGHGSLDSLRAPFIGLCGKAVFVDTDRRGLVALDADDFTELDQELKQRVARAVSPDPAASAACRTGQVRPWQPLPLLGIPGATSDNETADYYTDTRQFRPPRHRHAGRVSGESTITYNNCPI